MAEAYESNDLAKTSEYIAKEAGVGFYNNSLLLPMIDTQYSSEFGTVSGGARVGNTVRVKFPAQFVTTNSKILDGSTLQPIVEQTKILTLDQRVGVHAEIDTEQATLEVAAEGSEYSERVLQPMGKALAAKIESVGFEKMALTGHNTLVIADADLQKGDVIRKAFVQVRAMLDKQLAPAGDRNCVLGSDVELLVADSVLPLFHANSEIEAAYKEGKMGQFGGLTWGASNLAFTRVNGAGGKGGTVATYVNGAETMTITAAVSGDLDALAVGDKITINVKLVNPETKVAYGNIIQRAIKSKTGTGATVTVGIDPIFATDGDARQNAKGTVVGATVAVLGEAGESYLVCPVWQKKALTLASADLYLPKHVEMASRNKVMNVAQRFIRDYQIGNDGLPSRYESLFTIDTLRPEWLGAVEYKIS